MTVGDLEQRFQDVYGLSVQVFRKSGKVWLETTVTDNWTLDEQNDKEQSLSNYLEANKEEMSTYRDKWKAKDKERKEVNEKKRQEKYRVDYEKSLVERQEEFFKSAEETRSKVVTIAHMRALDENKNWKQAAN